MKLNLASANVKIIGKNDVVELRNPKCLINEAFTFQVYVENAIDGEYSIVVDSDLDIAVYEVVKCDGKSYINTIRDDFYIRAEDDKYPELLLPSDKLIITDGEDKTLFFVVSEEVKSVGVHSVEVSVGEEKTRFDLTVVGASLENNDMIVTHWFHSDAICNHYGVKPFSEEYYKHFEDYIAAYARMGNTMLLVPLFTPPLDTEVGGERLTTQLVKVEKNGDEYSFDFSETKRYVDTAKRYGIKYFELSHLFTQWGGEFCPKIIAVENGEEKRIFGWNVESLDPKYLNFLKRFFVALNEFLIAEGIKENSFMHLTDEPSAAHIDKYVELMNFVKANNFGIKTMDALSHYAFVEKAGLNLPAVSTQSSELALFDNVERLLYYCVGTDINYLTNRYFFMPTLRTQILGMQLYKENVAGFLHWGYNFYNTRYSRAALNPYEDATAGGEFISGDSFVVYPATDGVNYSVRYFALMKAFEDYRLLKTVEKKIGREKTVELLEKFGMKGLHDYSREVRVYEDLRGECYAILAD